MPMDASQFRTVDPTDATSIKIAIAQNSYIADEVYTPVYVNKSEFKVYHYDTSHMRPVETRSSSKSKAKEVDYGVFTKDRALELHKLKAKIDPKDVANADQPVADMELDHSENIMNRLLLKRESMMVDIVGDSAKYPAALVTTLAAGSTWADADGNPEADISAIKEAVWAKCGVEPRALAIGQLGLYRLRQSPALKSRLHYSNEGKMISLEELKALFDLDEINVCRALYESAAKGAASSMAALWGDFSLLYVKAPSQNLRQIRFAADYIRKQLYTHRYQDDELGSGDGRIQWIEKGWEFSLEPGAVVSSSDDDFSAGGLIKNIY